MPEQPIPAHDNRPPEGEIPDILEWKLDVLMAQLARMGGGQPAEHNPTVGGTRERLPDPKKFDPVNEHVPDYPGIPKILEWKLDVIMAQLGRVAINLNVLPPAINIFLIPIIFVLVGGLGAIIALLALIAGILSGIQALLLFLVVQIAVPFIVARNKRRLAKLFPPGTP
jgi:hypothetical protein